MSFFQKSFNGVSAYLDDDFFFKIYLEILKRNIEMETANAGTVESGDIYIELTPDKQNEGVKIELNSTVESQFGDQIKNVILQTLEELKVSGVTICATDKGALDCTIRARVTAAVSRATGKNIWE